jgi:hypothetical protein
MKNEERRMDIKAREMDEDEGGIAGDGRGINNRSDDE